MLRYHALTHPDFSAACAAVNAIFTFLASLSYFSAACAAVNVNICSLPIQHFFSAACAAVNR